MNIETVLKNYQVEISGLLRRHKIAGEVNIETIRRAHDQKGVGFMMDLLKIITPESGFSTLLTPMGQAVITPALVIPESYTQAKEAETAAAAGSGKAWNFWDNLLSYVGKTAATIGQAKTAISSPGAESLAELPADPAKKRTNTVYIVAAGFVVLIVAILIFRK